MKIRKGFVSNSSSSSFIILSDTKENDKLTINVVAPIDSLIEYEITNIKELNKYIEDFHCESIEDFLKLGSEYKNQYYIMKKHIKNGKSVLICDCSSEDDGIGRFLYDNYEDDYIIKGGKVLGEI